MGTAIALCILTIASNSAPAAHPGSYVLATDQDRVTISEGTTIETVKAVRKRYRGRFLWFRTGNQSWLIDDPEWIDRATAFFSEELALGPEQQSVAAEESALDHEEERLEKAHDAASEARLEEVRRKQREVSRREAELDQREEALERAAEEKLWSLIDDAIRKGVARRTR